MSQDKYINREISWLDFNARVLQEAANEEVPLIERLRFLGIFSNNLDEFFQVRYATIRQIARSKKTGKKVLRGITAKELLSKITQIAIEQQQDSLVILKQIKKEFEKENIFIIDEKQIDSNRKEYLQDYFLRQVVPALTVTIFTEEKQGFKDNRAFLMIKMVMKEDVEGSKNIFAAIEIPSQINRFIVLPKEGKSQHIMLLDDLIRFHLELIFNMIEYSSIEAHMVKITRDSELELDDDIGKSYIEKLRNSVRDRIIGDPVRLVYDKNISKDTLDFITTKLDLSTSESLIPGGRYHHRRDYMTFPNLGRKDLVYNKQTPLAIKGLPLKKSVLQAIGEKDYLMYSPYHSFFYIIKALREAALDPRVKTIKITLYRLAKHSQIISSLINATKNGKKVIVQIELQARFDEKNNIHYAEKLEEAGVHLIFGIPGLKVHTKVCVIERLEKDNTTKLYGFVSTGNFNESSADIYTDYILLTSDQKILKDVSKVFDFLEDKYKPKKYKHLIVSPHYTFSKLTKLIDREIEFANNGERAYIRMKLNNLTNVEIIDKLYKASQAGVKIDLIVRGMCCLLPQIKELSENIRVISILDKFLEHPRVFIFENGGSHKIYISSADMMTRNIFNRVEVACPIYDIELQKQLLDTFTMSWNDNVKARWVNLEMQNQMKSNSNQKPLRSQWGIYNYYKDFLINENN